MTLHLYAQELWHDEAFIAGSREDLELLRRTIDQALDQGSGRMQAFVCDGEGYTVQVVQVTHEQADAMPVPYTDDVAKAGQDRMQYGPWALLRADRIAKVAA